MADAAVVTVYVNDALVAENERLRAEVEQLREEDAISDDVRKRQSALLHATANALHGGPLKDGWWSHHNLPELARTLVAENERLWAEHEKLRIDNDRYDAAIALRDIEIERLRSALERVKREYFDNTTSQSECLSNIYSIVCESLDFGMGRVPDSQKDAP